MEKKSAWEKFGPVMVVVMVGMAFALGALWSKSQYLSNVATNTGGTGTTGTQAAAPKPVTVDIKTIKDLFSMNVVKFGNADSKLLFVEVADPSCPFCHVAAGKNGELNTQIGERFKLVADGGKYVAPVVEMKKLVDAGKAGFVWIYTNGHGNGEMGTKALYCANEKNKFWEAHDLLMSGAGYDLLNNTVKNDVTKAGELAEFLKPAVNFVDMKACLESGKYESRLSEDSQLAASLGINGTPGFYINTTNFAGAYSWTDMQSAADAALK